MTTEARLDAGRVSLDCLSLTSCTHAELIRAAAAAGFGLVSLWLNRRAAYPRQVVPLADQEVCVDLLAHCGVGVSQIEAFDLVSPTEIAAWRPLFAMGAALGAKSVLFYNGSVGDRTQVVESLRTACRLAERCGLSVNLEPIALGHTRTLHEAQRLIEDAGVDAGIVFDFLHHVRAGGTVADLRAVDPRRIRHVQVNDGPPTRPVEEWQSEAMSERAWPGEGAFPIRAFLAALPRDAVIGIEAPSARRTAAGMAPARQAEGLMAALREVLAGGSGSAS